MLALALIVPGVAQAGGVGVRIDPQDGAVPQDGSFILRVAPGGEATGRFALSNTGEEPVRLSVYAVAGRTGGTTGVVYDNEAGRGAGGWLTPDVTTLVQPGQSERTIGFSLRLPIDVRAGDHAAGIAIEQRRADTSVSQIVRSVVPVLVEVPGGAPAAGRVAAPAIGVLPGTSEHAVHATIGNDGERICSPRLTVTLTGDREQGSPVTRELERVLPGDEVRYALPWPRKLRPGSFAMAATVEGCGAPRTIRDTVKHDPSTQPTDIAIPGASGGGSGPAAGAGGGSGYVAGPAASRRRADAGPAAPAAASGDKRGGPVAGGGAPSAGAPADPRDATAGDRSRELAELIPPIVERAGPALLVLGLLLLAFLLQEAFDRRDPKLALAPVHRDPDLTFRPLPELQLGAPKLEPPLITAK